MRSLPSAIKRQPLAADELGTILEGLTDGVIVFDRHNRVKAFNARYAEIFHLRPGDIVVGDSIESVVRRIAEAHGLGVEDRPLDEVVEKRLDLWGTEQDRFERRRMRDGRVLDIFRSATANGDLVSVHIDVTDRVRGEEAFVRQRSHMLSILENIADGVCLVDAEGHYIAFNTRLLELYGIDPSKVSWGVHFDELAPHFADLAALSPARRAAEVAKRRRFTLDPTPCRLERNLFNGRTLEIVKSASPDGGSVMTIRDVTEELRNRRALEEARQNAEESNRLKSRFLSRMSHEMRTPLNGILGIGALLRRTALDARQIEFVEVIRNSGMVLLRLIDDLLDMARVEAETFDVVHERFALCQVIAECVRVIEPEAREKGLEVRKDPSPVPLPPVMGDAVRMKQVLLNLLSNAVKFTDAGSVTAGLRVELGEDDALVHIFVSDTGIGIAEADQARIFQQFFQVEDRETRRFGGVGLGLTITRKIVEAMGGSISVASEPGKGSTFTVSLRMTLAPDAVSAAPPRRPADGKAPRTGPETPP